MLGVIKGLAGGEHSTARNDECFGVMSETDRTTFHTRQPVEVFASMGIKHRAWG
jgi:hypothetical protein